MLAALTSVNEPHHQASGFDQAKDLETDFAADPGKDFDCDLCCARHSRLIRHSARIRNYM
jgi:hypothetical protein